MMERPNDSDTTRFWGEKPKLVVYVLKKTKKSGKEIWGAVAGHFKRNGPRLAKRD